jgi:hypothetical protein
MNVLKGEVHPIIKAQRGSRGIALLFLATWSWLMPCLGCFTPRNDPVPIV